MADSTRRGRRATFRILVVAATVSMLAYVLIAALSGPSPSSSLSSADVAARATQPADEHESATRGAVERGAVERVASVVVEPGDTLGALLTRAGVGETESRAVIDAMRAVFLPRAIRPGQRIELTFAQEFSADSVRLGTPAGSSAFSTLLRLALRPSPEREIRVARTTHGGFEAEEIGVPLERRTVLAHGTIRQSLYLAASKASVPPKVMAQAIRLFGFSVDFQRDIQPGDEFSLLYETLHDESGAQVGTGDVLHAELEVNGVRQRLWRFTGEDGRIDYFDGDGRSARRTLMRTPIDGARLSSGYGMRRHPVLGYSRAHKGIDFAAPTGTPIWAAGDGTVVEAGWKNGYGRYVRIRHGGGYETAYAHMSRFAKGVTRGSRVSQGDVVGYVGATGLATGPHLHYEVLIDGRHHDPRTVELPEGRALQGTELARFHDERMRLTEMAVAARVRPTLEARASDIGFAGPYLR